MPFAAAMPERVSPGWTVCGTAAPAGVAEGEPGGEEGGTRAGPERCSNYD